MKILVLGAGALGGYFGGWLAKNGADVTFLARPARKAQLDRDGLRIESPVGALSRPVQTQTQDQIKHAADVVLLTAKAYDLDSAIEAIRPAVGPNTAVLPILNGITHIDRLVAEFGGQRMLGGLAKIQATLKPDGTIQTMGQWNEIVFGELDGRMSERVTQLAALFPKPQVQAQAVPDIKAQLWRKLVHLGTVASVTTLTRQAIGIVNQTRDGVWLIESTFRSTAAIAAAEGYPMAEPMIRDYLKVFSEAGSTYKASMLRDMERGGKTEGAHILGYLAERAAAHGIANPIFRIAAVNTDAYEVARNAERHS